MQSGPKASGSYAGIRPVDLYAHALRALLERTAIDPLAIDYSADPPGRD